VSILGSSGQTANLLNVNNVGQATGTIFNIQANGSVGIGTTSPNYRLEVAATENALNVSNSLFVNGTSGYVGIGTTSPAVKLHVFATSGNQLELDGSGQFTSLSLDYNNIFQGFVRHDSSNGRMEIGTVNTNPLRFWTNSATRMIIDKDGYVGIGTTSPQNKLEVVGTINASALKVGTTDVCLSTGTNCPTMGGVSSAAGWQNTSTLVSLVNTSNNVSANTLFVDNSNGRVGIGTTAPTATLTVNGSSAAGSLLVQNTTGSTHLFINGTSGTIGIGTASPTATLTVSSSSANGAFLVQNTSGSNLLLIDGSTGYIGIGEAAADKPLHIVKTSTDSSGADKIMLWSQSYANPSADTSARFFSLISESLTSDTNTKNIGEVLGATLIGYHQGSGTLSAATGLYAQTYNINSGSITNAHALMAAGTSPTSMASTSRTPAITVPDDSSTITASTSRTSTAARRATTQSIPPAARYTPPATSASGQPRPARA
jgi:hypothetical protein